MLAAHSRRGCSVFQSEAAFVNSASVFKLLLSACAKTGRAKGGDKCCWKKTKATIADAVSDSSIVHLDGKHRSSSVVLFSVCETSKAARIIKMSAQFVYPHPNPPSEMLNIFLRRCIAMETNCLCANICPGNSDVTPRRGASCVLSPVGRTVQSFPSF